MKLSKRSKYHLTVCPGDNLQGPTDEEIIGATWSLPGGRPSFVILQKKKCHFMQAGGSAEEGFTLEYQEFSTDGHWQHVGSPDVDIETVNAALTSYARDEDSWRELPWRRVTRSENVERAVRVAQEIEAELDAENGQPVPSSPPQPPTLWEDVKGLAAGAVEVMLEEIGLLDKRRKR